MSEPRFTVTLGPGRVARKRLSRAPDSTKGLVFSSAVMYADLEENRSKTDLRGRLVGAGNGPGGVKARLSGGAFGAAANNAQGTTGKRQRQEDDKWQHDLYADRSKGPGNLQPGDLRRQLSRRAGGRGGGSSGAGTGVADLREKLSGSAAAPPASVGGPPAKQRRVAAGAAGLRVEAALARQAPAGNQGGPKAPSAAAKGAQGGGRPQTVTAFLTGLGLAKYIAAFQVEEIDMTALRHLREEDLKEMGIPMGPRKKIILALNPQS